MTKRSNQSRMESPIEMGSNMDDDGSDGERSESFDYQSTIHGSSFHDEKQPSEEEKVAAKEIASRESRQVTASKLLVGFVLAASATCAGFFTYKFMSNEEHVEFERKFNLYASELIELSAKKAVNTFTHSKFFADEVTSLARYGGSNWPFFTAEDFHVRATDYHEITGCLSSR